MKICIFLLHAGTHNDENSAGVIGGGGEEDHHTVDHPGEDEGEEAAKNPEDAPAHHQLLLLLVFLGGHLGTDYQIENDSTDEEDGNGGEEGVDKQPGGEGLVARPLYEGNNECNDEEEEIWNEHPFSSTAKLKLYLLDISTIFCISPDKYFFKYYLDFYMVIKQVGRSWAGQGKGKNLWGRGGAGQGKGQNLWRGAGRGKGQNLLCGEGLGRGKTWISQLI